MSFYHDILLRSLITMLTKSHLCLGSNTFKAAGTCAEHTRVQTHGLADTNKHTHRKTHTHREGSMLNSRPVSLNQMGMR